MPRPEFDLGSDSDDNAGEGLEERNPPSHENSPRAPESPVVVMADLTPHSKKIAKVITGAVMDALKQENSGVKRKLDLVLETGEQTKGGVDHLKAESREIKRTTQTIDANQRKSMKMNPKDALDNYQQKQIKRFVWPILQVADPKNELASKVFNQMEEVDDKITKAQEDAVKKFAAKEATNAKSHLRALIVDDLLKSDYIHFNSSANWIKNHLVVDMLTETDWEFLRIMACATIKFENGRDVELQGRDLANKEKIGDSVDFWWSYVGQKVKKFKAPNGESCATALNTLMAQYGYEGKEKKRRQSL